MSLEEYYDRRAAEYEEMYFRDDPVRRAELQEIAGCLREHLVGRDVLEIACGTGYWTKVVSDVAESILAVDSAAKMLEIAIAKSLPAERVTFQRGDAFALNVLPGQFDAAVANFWLSHVSKDRVGDFLEGLSRRLGSGARVVMADNVYLPGCGGELVTDDSSVDSYKRRKLEDGSEYLVLKNYYSEDQLRELFAAHATDLTVRVAKHFWWVSYTVA